MKHVLILAAIAAFATGCASTSEVEALDARVGVLEGKVATASADAASAKTAAADASVKAAAAEAAANKAAQYAQEVKVKLDRMFNKAQFK